MCDDITVHSSGSNSDVLDHVIDLLFYQVSKLQECVSVPLNYNGFYMYKFYIYSSGTSRSIGSIFLA